MENNVAPPVSPPLNAFRHGGAGGVLFSREVFDSARVLLACHVFLCHAFFQVHWYMGWLAVAGFFFISGYGMSFPGKRESSLYRLPRYLFVLLFFALIYWFKYSVLFYPTAWFLISYAFVMLVYRFLGRFPLLFTFVLSLSFVFLWYIQVDYVWYMSPFAFLFGFWVYRYPHVFRLPFCLSLLPFAFLSSYFMPFLLFVFPLYFWIVLHIAARIPLAFFAPLTFPFFSLHCWILAFFGSTWTLGGSFISFRFTFLAFLLSWVGAYLLWRFVPLFNKSFHFKKVGIL